jgi:hypothetical protein
MGCLFSLVTIFFSPNSMGCLFSLVTIFFAVQTNNEEQECKTGHVKGILLVGGGGKRRMNMIDVFSTYV